MFARVIEEAGYKAAMIGLGLSYGITSHKEYDSYEVTDKEHSVLSRLAGKDEGHNKALESMIIWVDVSAPLFWWKQADTYRISSKQSESTMHTLSKQHVTLDDIEAFTEKHNMSPDAAAFYTTSMRQQLEYINIALDNNWWEVAIRLLPEAFIQRRIWCMSYKTLRNILVQRYVHEHKLKEWAQFCDEVVAGLQHPELLGIDLAVLKKQ